MSPLLVVVYDFGSAGPADIVASARGACEVVLACDPTAPHVAANLAVLRAAAPVVEFGAGPDALVAAVAPLRPAGITTFSEFQLNRTAHAAERLGLRFHDRAAALAVTDKSRQRELLARAGIPTAAHHVLTTAEDVGAALGAVGLPAVLKPRHGAGSTDTFLVTTPDECVAAVAQVRPATWRAGGLVLEQLLAGDPAVAGPDWGDYVSVESVVADGAVRHVAVTGKFPLAKPFRERGQFVPATLPAGPDAEVRALATAAIHALALRHGVTHTEIKLTPDGPRVIEVNGRVGGHVAGLLRRAAGYDLLRAAMAVAVGTAPPAEPPTCRRVAFRRYLAPPPERVVLTSLAGVTELAGLPGVEHVETRARPGQFVDPRNGTQECLGAVDGRAEDHEALLRHTTEIDRRVRAEYVATDAGTDVVAAAFLAAQRKYTGEDVVDLGEPGHYAMSGTTTLADHVAGVTAALAGRTPVFDPIPAAHLAAALRRLTNDPTATLADIDLLAPGERARVLEEFNATRRDYPRDSTIDEVFTTQVTTRPDAEAVVCGDVSLTYRQLDERVTACAESLVAHGVRPGDRVASLFGKVPEMVVTTLAILRAGAAYVPLDPRLPAERREFLLRDSGSAALVTETGITVRAAAEGTPGTAYVMYTSGTTGTPKGVLVPQRAVLRLVCGSDFARLGPGTRILQTGALGFDAATFEIWGALLTGGTVVLVPDEVILDAPALGDAISRHGITTMWLTAPLFHQLVDQDATIFRPVREVLAGGDVLSPRHIAAALIACPGLRVVNGYGPTENTTFSATHLVTEPPTGPIPIGRPVTNSTAYVVDLDGRPQPVGVAGELLVGGDGLADGYLNRPAEDAERFVADPRHPGERLYRTGDLARWRPDGVLEFLGRKDRQVKIRGFRVEPDEVERHLAGLPGITAAAVLVARRPDGVESYLRAFFTADRRIPAAECRAALSATLPAHLVPAEFTQVDTMPLNRNGKIDRAALPGMAATGDGQAVDGGVAGVLARLWREVLGTNAIGAHDDIFDLGVTSLSAAAFAARARAEFGPWLSSATVLANPTIDALARVVRGRGSEDETPALTPAPTRALYPVTWQQHAIYVEQLKDGTATHYNVPFTVHARVDPDRLGRAVSALVRRHESLRTTFTQVGAEVFQRVHEHLRVDVEDLDEGSFVRPFDLTEGPLLRVGLSRDRFMVDLHHIIADGVTAGVLLTDLDALYRDEPRAEPAARYRDYAVWQAEHGEEWVLRRQEAFWRNAHADPPPRTDLPTDAARPAMRGVAGARHAFTLGPAGPALAELGRRCGGTPFHALLSAYLLFLAEITGDGDLTVGVPVDGRTLPGTERVAGMFANTVCLRTRLDPAWSCVEFVRRVRDHMVAAMSNQDYPFARLVGAVATDREQRRHPLFDTMLGFQPAAMYGRVLGGVAAPADALNPCTMFDLNLQVYERADTWDAVWAYSTTLFREETVGVFAKHLLAVVDAVLARPDRAIGELVGAAPAATGARTGAVEFDFTAPATSGHTSGWSR